jgi:hypothetical protein
MPDRIRKLEKGKEHYRFLKEGSLGCLEERQANETEKTR